MYKNPKRITNCTNCGGKIPRKFPKLRNPNDFELENSKQEQNSKKNPNIRSPDDENILFLHKIDKKHFIKQQRISLGFLPQR